MELPMGTFLPQPPQALVSTIQVSGPSVTRILSKTLATDLYLWYVFEPRSSDILYDMLMGQQPRAFSRTSDSPSSPPSSIWSLLNAVDGQLAEIKHAKEVARSIIEAATSQRITEEDKNKTMQPCEEPSDVSHLQGDSCHDSRHTTENDTTKNQNAFASACTIPLPAQTQQEEMMLREKLTQMEEEEIQEGRFHKTPLEVADGIAVLEESVEMHVPDVMTQF